MKSIWKNKFYFTLVELMVAMTIMAILAAMASVGISYALSYIAETKTKASIIKVDHALRVMYERYGMYPVQHSDKKFYLYPGVYNAITKKYDFSNAATKYSVPSKYVEELYKMIGFSGSNGSVENISVIDDGTDVYLSDEWDMPLIYRNPGIRNNKSFDLYSFGSDMMDYFDPTHDPSLPEPVDDDIYNK